jgi:putative lipoprotein
MRWASVLTVLTSIAILSGCTMCGHEFDVICCPPTSGIPWQDTTAVQHVALTGTSWRLAEFATGAVRTTGSETRPFIEFADDTTFTGHGGCNRIFGRRSGQPPKLTLSGIGSTKMYCRDAMDVETSFIATLESCRSYWVVDEQLELYGTDGSLLARLTRR